MIGWPVEESRPGSRFWTDQLAAGLRSAGVSLELRSIEQPAGDVLIAELDDGSGRQLIAFDREDSPEIDEEIAARTLLYFKMQYASGGYAPENVVPGGYMPANGLLYRHLRRLRTIRSLRRFRYDVYGRFGLRYGGVEIRRRAFELLSARDDFTFEGSLFRYPGGPEKVPYREYLYEIARARVCVDLPGAGDLCNRLIDYLAVGACVVGPPPRVRLPVPLVDGEHIVHCAPDLSDLSDVCARLARDDAERERIARNARDYFDRHLHRRALGSYYLDHIAAASSRESGPAPEVRQMPGRRAARALALAVLTAVVAVDVLVVLPEKLGDWPYNALGHNSRHPVSRVSRV